MTKVQGMPKSHGEPAGRRPQGKRAERGWSLELGAWNFIGHWVLGHWSFCLACLGILFAQPAPAEEPSTAYIFPTGGQRGTTVAVRVGGHYLHGNAGFELLGGGVKATARIIETNTVWFEGPLIVQPASQRKEDYPRDHAGRIEIAPDAPLGVRHWRVWTSQGATPALKFVVGDLPEVVEVEVDGRPAPVTVKPPVTINGRTFPREDVDEWSFAARKGEVFTCSVAALALGSPLEARIVVIDPAGVEIAEALPGRLRDPRLSFRAAREGVHTVRIHDLNFGGLQHHVYRLTISPGPEVAAVFPLGGRRGQTLALRVLGSDGSETSQEVRIPGEDTRGTPAAAEASGHARQLFPTTLRLAHGRATAVTLETGKLPELIAGDTPTPTSFTAPVVLNGRLLQTGAAQQWKFTAKKGEELEFTIAASRLGSPLLPVLTVADATGKQVARSGVATAAEVDPVLLFKAAKDDEYTVTVRDRFASRGGPDFAYRVTVAPPAGPDFELSLGLDAINAVRDSGETATPPAKRKGRKEDSFHVSVRRIGGFKGDVKLEFPGLPDGVSVSDAILTAKKDFVIPQFTAAPRTTIGAHHVTVRGTAEIDGRPITRTAVLRGAPGEPEIESVLLAVALPTPFRTVSDYLLQLPPAGSVVRREYQIERGGFTGPLTARLADRQIRHLQGVTGPELVIPPGRDRFEYPLTLPPGIELGRTSRAQVMLSGEFTDFDGSRHILSYSSGGQNDQIISIPSGGLLQVALPGKAFRATPRGELELEIRVTRAQSLRALAVRAALVVPASMTGVRAEPVSVPAAKDTARLRIHFDGRPGPFTQPLIVRVETIGGSDPHAAEAAFELVPPAEIAGRAAAAAR